MNGSLDWPALTGYQGLEKASYERGIWGKLQGAETDFRWIARSAGFGQQNRGIEHQLAAGTEDLPGRASFWRSFRGDNADRWYYAVATYSSRARDASERTGFLEKQILEWRQLPEVPAVVGAFLLLPRVAEWTDTIWWEHCGDPRWAQADFFWPIGQDTGELSLEVSQESLISAIEEGRNALRARTDQAALGHLYAQVLARQRPAILQGLAEPLPPLALAALLLPLPREMSDRLSLAGWLPSSRGSFEDLGQLWDVVIPPPDFGLPARPDLDPSQVEKGKAMAGQLLASSESSSRPPEVVSVPQHESEPVRLPAAPSPPPPPAPSQARDLPIRPRLRLEIPVLSQKALELKALYDFACNVDCRWLDPETLGRQRLKSVPSDSDDAKALRCWPGEIERQRPSFANGPQWEVKVDLLRSAALCLAPDASTFAEVKLPTSRYVPALLFASLLKRPEELWRLGEKNLVEALEQSLRCETDLLVTRLQDWLRNSDLRKLLGKVPSRSSGAT